MTTAPSTARADLVRRLLQHLPGDDDERRDVERTIRLVTEHAGCFSRAHFDPGHVTGSGFVVSVERRELLLLHHRRLGRWLQMGGHDEGEHDPAATALREAREESGLTDLELLGSGILDVDVHSVPAGRGEPDHHHFDVRYALGTRRPEEARWDPSEASGLRWLSLEAAADLMDEPAARRAIGRLSRLLKG